MRTCVCGSVVSCQIVSFDLSSAEGGDGSGDLTQATARCTHIELAEVSAVAKNGVFAEIFGMFAKCFDVFAKFGVRARVRT